MGMGGKGNVESHSRTSLVYTASKFLTCSLTNSNLRPNPSVYLETRSKCDITPCYIYSWNLWNVYYHEITDGCPTFNTTQSSYILRDRAQWEKNWHPRCSSDATSFPKLLGKLLKFKCEERHAIHEMSFCANKNPLATYGGNFVWGRGK